MKVKFLIEELSTINQMKKSFLSLYENWLCQFCGEEEEHFDHVWTCQENLEILTQIRDYIIIKLIEEIKKMNLSQKKMIFYKYHQFGILNTQTIVLLLLT